VAVDTHAGHGHAGHGHADGHGILHHHFDDMEQQRECTSLAMWLFLATEMMMFGGLFFAYSLYRWKFAGGFHVGSSHLNIFWGTINTFVLLFSSLTMALAVHSATHRNRQQLVLWLTATWILGLAFLGIKGVEWAIDYREGLIPAVSWFFYSPANPHYHEAMAELAKWHTNPQQVMMYFVVYFSMTGLHAIHMIVGLALVGVFIRMAAQGKFTNGNDQPVEVMGLYWHFVDIVWVFLFPLLYLIAGFHLGGGGH
jgi:cytochrome c oxidase subunit III